MADKSFRVLALAALAALSLANVGLAANPVTSSIADSYGTATAPALRLPSSNSSAAMHLWHEDPAPAPTAAATSDCQCGGSACSACCGPVWYGQADLLVWWMKGNQVPALVTTSPDGTQRPQAGVLGQPGTSVLVGGGLDDNYRPGVRFTVGRWLGGCQNNGLEMTYFTLGDGANSGNFFAGSTGSPILARPFYNVLLDREDAQLVALPNVVEGTVSTETDSELHSVALLLRHNLSDDCCRRFDLVGGYRYLRFREALAVREFLTSTDPGGTVAVGTTFDILDAFETENDFHGGEIGVDALFRRGCWDFTALAKIAAGNMHQSATVDGVTTITVPSQPGTVGAGGLLALPTNMGTTSWDEFALIPELNLGVRYHFTDRLSLTAGYSLLWITEVARTGGQIDSVVNTSQLPGGGGLVGPARPQSVDGHSDVWMQGVNLGVVWEF